MYSIILNDLSIVQLELLLEHLRYRKANNEINKQLISVSLFYYISTNNSCLKTRYFINSFLGNTAKIESNLKCFYESFLIFGVLCIEYWIECLVNNGIIS